MYTEMKSKMVETSFKYFSSVWIKKREHKTKITSFHSCLLYDVFKQFFGGQVANFRLGGFVVVFFFHSICVCIVFPIIQSFSQNKETRISDIGPRGKKRTNQNPMPILPPPPPFSFYVSEKATKVIVLKNNFVKYLVPVKAWLVLLITK